MKLKSNVAEIMTRTNNQLVNDLVHKRIKIRLKTGNVYQTIADGLNTVYRTVLIVHVDITRKIWK